MSIVAPSVKTFTDNGFTKEQAKTARAIIKGEKDPLDFPATEKWFHQCFHKPGNVQLKMSALNEVLGGFGVETIIKGSEYDYPMDIRAEYVNMGDTYNATIVRNSRTGTYRLTTWGDFVERNRI